MAQILRETRDIVDEKYLSAAIRRVDVGIARVGRAQSPPPASTIAHGPVCRKGAGSYPLGNPLQAILISVPSHAQPAAYARQRMAGDGKHWPFAVHAGVVGKPHCSLGPHPALVVHGMDVPPASLGSQVPPTSPNGAPEVLGVQTRPGVHVHGVAMFPPHGPPCVETQAVPESLAALASTHAPVCENGLEVYPLGNPVQTVLISLPSHAQPGEYALQSAPVDGKQCPCAAHDALSTKPQSPAGPHSALVVQATCASPPLPESAATPASTHGPACRSGFEPYPLGNPVQAMLISLPSHAQPKE